MEILSSGDLPRQNSKFHNSEIRGWTKIGGLFLLLVISRLIPHPPNATAVTATAWFAEEKFRGFGAMFVIAGLVVSDIFIGFYDWRLLFSVYGSFVLITFLGRYVGNNATYAHKTIVSTLAAFFFFLITNGMVWALSSWYPHTSVGLLASYVAGLPFLRNMIIGDIAYFGIIHAVKKFPIYNSWRVVKIVATKRPMRPI